MVSRTSNSTPRGTNQIQAPKNLPAAAKQQKILEYFRESMSVFTLKELEKILPAVASINAMQVKDVLQGLQDENLICVEKIGSGNWYWCFTSDAKKLKENTINTLKTEESKLVASIAETERQIEEEMGKREDDNEMLESNGMDRKALLEAHNALLKEAELLDKELASYSDSDPAEVQSKMEEVKKLKASAIKWTDNIESLECMLLDLIKDRNQTAEVMQTACGDEYIQGEGLKEL
jgi:Mnd1 HTH domain